MKKRFSLLHLLMVAALIIGLAGFAQSGKIQNQLVQESVLQVQLRFRHAKEISSTSAAHCVVKARPTDGAGPPPSDRIDLTLPLAELATPKIIASVIQLHA